MNGKTFSLWVLSAAVCASAFLPAVGIAGDEPTQPAAPPIDPYIACMKLLASDPQFASLAEKLPIGDFNNIPFAMLADNSLPTPQERKDLLAWFDKRDKCWKDSEPFHERQWPP